MENEKTQTVSLNEFLKEIAINGVFLKYKLVEEYAKLIPDKENGIIKTYILKDEYTGLYKIGKTSNLKKRLSILKCGNPFVSLIATIDIDCESELHKLFDSKRFEREWFKLTDGDIDFIIQEYNTSIQ